MSAKPILFEAAMASSGNPFTIDRDGDAVLRLQVPGRFIEEIAANIGWLFGGSFIVTIQRVEPGPSDLPKT